MKNLILLLALLPTSSFALSTDLCVSQRDTNSVLVQDTVSGGTVQVSKDQNSGSISVKKPIEQVMGGGGGIGTGMMRAMAATTKFNSFVTEAGVNVSSNAEVLNVVAQIEDCTQ